MKKKITTTLTKEKRLGVIMSEEMFEELRKLSYEEHRSMNELSREGISYILKKYKKGSAQSSS